MGQVPSRKEVNGAPRKQTQEAVASPQGRASEAALSGNNRLPDRAPGQGRLPKSRALARGPGSIAEDPEGQGRLPKGRTTEESPSGSSSFAGDAFGPGANAPQADTPSGDLMQCEGCGRSFNQRAFEVHSRICAKIFQVSPADQRAFVLYVLHMCHMCSSASLSLCPYVLQTLPLLLKTILDLAFLNFAYSAVQRPCCNVMLDLFCAVCIASEWCNSGFPVEIGA